MSRSIKSINLCLQSCRFVTNTATTRKFHKLRSVSMTKNYIQESLPTSGLYIHKRYTQSRPLKCWKCGIERAATLELFCEKCSVIQGPLQKQNYFSVFGLEENFNIDQKSLRQKYREMQNVLHPDKFSNKSDEEKEISEEFSSLVNKAYATLQSPLSRAIHLLKLKGGKIEEGQKVDDPAFLMEIMELNEEVEAARTPEQLKELNVKNKKMMQEICDRIEDCFNNGDVIGAKNQIIKMKYFNSVSLHVNSILRERGIVDD